ncbi:MAG: hypothetical protein E6Z64_08245 [Streptococcus parasanguinis]|jgi:hypothetical protein|uniref:hypothetical protein n=1 Tax=Streptococcus parasanguinis TaxID=1318 RepID=UPI00066E541E|nr:hypothetical protein [Streptococcus parasanguinis]MDU5707553.1 hypothetical protein [Streptococcus parasanguinis]MDU5845586.1 hypothetical protein [Streptococcus parasanguinis]
MIIEKNIVSIKNQANYFKSLFESKIFEGPYKNFIRNTARNRSDFPIFPIASDNYYFYKAYENLLQTYIRNYLINPILEELLTESGYKVDSYLEKIRIYNGFNNEKIENYNICPFQFIFIKNNLRYGVRYTKLYDTDDIVKDLIKNFQIDKVIILHFSDEQDFGLNQYREVINISDYSIKTFFEEFINGNLYNCFLTTLEEVIEEMHKLIGFNTIPRINIANVTSVKLDLRETIKNIDFQLLTYNSSKEFDSLGRNDISNICSNLEHGKAQVLIGESDFAQSYITSEYLYQVLVYKFNNNKLEYKFDYTSVVAGYLKTIEQFLYKILCYQMDYDRSEKWIKRGKKYVKRNHKRKYPREEEVRKHPDNDEGIYQVLVSRNNLKFMDISLGSLIWYVSDNEKCWNLSAQGKELLNKLLLDYKDSVRNGYFHKHNLEDIEEVKRIRENTLYLLCFIIGGLKDFDITKFGILDFSFNNFFLAISKVPKHIPLYIQETKTSQPKLMKLVYEQESESYNVDGLLENNLYFAEVDDPNKWYEYINQVPKDDLVIFNTNNVPYRAEYVGRSTDDGFINKVEFYRKD